MSIATVVTGGFGNGVFVGTITEVVTNGYTISLVVVNKTCLIGTPEISFLVEGDAGASFAVDGNAKLGFVVDGDVEVF